MGRYELSNECLTEIHDLLNQGKTIQEIYSVLQEKNLFRKKIATLRNRINENFKKVKDDEAEEWVPLASIKNTQIDLFSYTDKSNDPIPKAPSIQQQPEPNANSLIEKTTPKSGNKIIEVLSENPNSAQSNMNNPTSPPSLENIHGDVSGALYKLNYLERKINKLEKAFDEISKERQQQKELLKSIISMVADKLKDG